jgi:hypothetical protein
VTKLERIGGHLKILILDTMSSLYQVLTINIDSNSLFSNAYLQNYKNISVILLRKMTPAFVS